MLMDGKCINLINIWKKHDISAGDDMILVLRKMIPNDYVLSRQSGSYNRQRFNELPHDAKSSNNSGINLEDRRRQGVWQLVPWVYNMCHTPEDPAEYDFRENGYMPFYPYMAFDPYMSFDHLSGIEGSIP